MRLVPRSLFGRLLAIAAISLTAALLFAAFSIGHVLERFVMHGLDDRLDAQVQLLARAVRPDGSFDRTRVIDLPGFDEAGAGWSWRVDAPGGRQWVSAGGTVIPDPMPEPERRRQSRHRGEGSRPGDGHDRSGHALHFRTLTLTTPAGPVIINASGPRRIAEAPLEEAMVPLLVSLGLLGLGLGGATLLQLRFGLKPLRAIRAQLGEVIAGERKYVPVDQPTELVPLASELNRLIDQNEERLDHARRHVANLAHGLKTPLAALRLKLADTGDDSLTDAIDQMDRRIGHHLRRARAAAPGGVDRAQTQLAPAIDDLLAVLKRIHADRNISIDLGKLPEVVVAVDAQDLDEMLGNLLDNAWRHARSRIALSSVIGPKSVRIIIEDDGPGLEDDEIAGALVRGQRIDEHGEGHGFGLAITQELAELYGGGLAIERSALGGVAVSLDLPLKGPIGSI